LNDKNLKNVFYSIKWR